MRYIGIITLLVLCLTLLLLTGCMTNTVTPEISMGNSNNPSSNNPNSNNYQNPSTDPVEEPVTEEPVANPSSNNYQNTSTESVEEPVTVEPAIVEVDTTKPVITGSRAPLPNSFGWNNTDVTVSFSCADNGLVQSGIAINTVAGKTLTAESKNQSVTNTGTCIDVAGNTANPVTISNINIDKTPPVVTITLPGTGEYVLNQSITATWSATDALSGVVSPVSGSVSIDTSSVGTKTFTLPAGTVKDKAGNSSLKVTKSYSVIADTEDPEMIYPQKWAIGDGTAGNPWANDCIQKAYNAVPAGGTIFLKAGYYTLGTLLNIKGKRCNIVGEGMGNTFIVTSMEHTTGIRVVDDYCTLKGFTLDADSQAENENRIGMALVDGNYITIEDIEVKNAGYTGIEFSDIDYATISNIYLHDNAWHGMHSSHETATEGRHNTFQYIYAWNQTHHGFDDGIIGATDCDNTYDNIQAWNCGKEGINIWSIVGGNISNCSAWDCDLYGIQIGYADGLNVYDSSFSFNNNIGIKIIASSNITFTNVISKNNNTGIAIEDCSNIVLTSCQSYDDRDTPLQQYGIQLTETNTGISLSNCKLSPNAIGEIYNPAGAVITVITEKKKLSKF